MSSEGIEVRNGQGLLTQRISKKYAGPGYPDPLLLSVVEAGQVLGVGTWAVRGLISRRRLPVVRVGRKLFVRRATLARFVESAERLQR